MERPQRARFSAYLLGLALLASACVSTQLDTSHEHAANAHAPTAPLLLDATLQPGAEAAAPATPAATPTPEAAHDHASPTAGVTYTCPMHPEVVRDAPGKCPICGMNLVKREAPAPGGKNP